MSLLLDFGHPKDATIAYLENSLLANPADMQDDKFNPKIFDSQYLKYAQVLLSDFENYMVVYFCEESAQYRSKSRKRSLSPQDVWKTKLGIEENPKGSEAVVSFQFDKDVEVTPHYSQWVQILWRPVQLENDGAKFNKNVDYLVVHELKVELSKMLPDIKIQEDYANMTHFTECNYSPYEAAYERA